MTPFSLPLFSRRELLTRCGVGMGMLGLTQLLGESGLLTAHAKASDAVNPLAPGHLQPYLDRTRPSVVSITFVAPGGARLAPGRLRGEVEMISQAFDEPARSQAATASGSSPATWILAGWRTAATRSLSLPPTPPATTARRRRRSAYRTAAASESSHPRTTGAAANAPSRAERGNPPSRGSLVQSLIAVRGCVTSHEAGAHSSWRRTQFPS